MIDVAYEPSFPIARNTGNTRVAARVVPLENRQSTFSRDINSQHAHGTLDITVKNNVKVRNTRRQGSGLDGQNFRRPVQIREYTSYTAKCVTVLDVKKMSCLTRDRVFKNIIKSYN